MPILNCCSLFAGRKEPATVNVSVSVFRDNMAKVFFADISETCNAWRKPHLRCHYGKPLNDASIFEVSSRGRIKTLVALRCVRALDVTSHVTIVVPFYCENRTSSSHALHVLCRAKVHMTILSAFQETQHFHWPAICDQYKPLGGLEPQEPINPLPSTTVTTMKSSPTEADRHRVKSSQQLSVEMLAIIGGSSTAIVFLSACITLKCW